MNTKVLCASCLMLAALLAPAHGQELTRIPRRVAFVREGARETLTPDQRALTGGLADYLYTSIAARQPIVRVEDREAAHSTVLVVTRREGRGAQVEVELIEDGRTTETTSLLLADSGNELAEYTRFVEQTAAAFAPHLDLVEPVVESAELGEEEALREVVRETDYADKLDRRFELTLWLSGLSRVYHDPLVDNPSTLATRDFSVFPLILDASYYLSRTFGLTFSFYFDYGDFFAFDMVEEDTGGGEFEPAGRARSTNVFLLPGLGVSYRTLGLFSAQFGAVFYYGAVYVDADDPVGPIGGAGDTGWLSYSFLSFNSGLAWNFHPRVSVRTRFGFSYDIRQLIFMDSGVIPYEMSYNGVFFNFFALGVSYRF